MNIEAYIKRFNFHNIAVLCIALLRDHGNGLSIDGPGFYPGVICLRHQEWYPARIAPMFMCGYMQAFKQSD